MWLLGGRDTVECPEQVQSNELLGVPVNLCVFVQLTVAATLPLIILQILLRKPIIKVPVNLLHKAEGRMVNVETTTGEVYRGKLTEESTS